MSNSASLRYPDALGVMPSSILDDLNSLVLATRTLKRAPVMIGPVRLNTRKPHPGAAFAFWMVNRLRLRKGAISKMLLKTGHRAPRNGPPGSLRAANGGSASLQWGGVNAVGLKESRWT